MMTRRIMGKASFVTLQDVGGRIQLYVARDDLPEGVYNEQFKNGTSAISSRRAVSCSKPKPASSLSTAANCVC
jgi:lysyl-tRNA synthetase class 2